MSATYRTTPSLAAARFFGVTNELLGSVHTGVFTADSTGLRRVTTLPGGPAVLVIRPETITLATLPWDDDTVHGVAVAARFAGTHLAVDVRWIPAA